MEAHDEAVEVVAQIINTETTFSPTTSRYIADKAIRAYLAKRREIDGAGLYVVPADLPPGFHNSTDPRGFYPKGYNAALAAVRAAAVEVECPLDEMVRENQANGLYGDTP